MRKKRFGRLTPSQESVYRYLNKTTRWLTAYEISKLTGVSEGRTGDAIRELRKADLVSVRKRIGGFDNGEREFRASSNFIGRCVASRIRYQTDRITGVEPLAKRLGRILGKAKAEQYAEFIQ